MKKIKKYFAFSDTHGCFTELQNALIKAGFDRNDENHILIGVGDYFDRGLENKKLLEFLYEMYKEKRLEYVLGNHDEMLLDFMTGKDDGIFNATRNGMAKTLAQFSGLRLDAIPERLAKYPNLIIEKIKENHPYLIGFLEAAKDEINIGKYKFIHAGYTQNGEFYSPYDQTEWEIDNWTVTPNWVVLFRYSKIYDLNTIYVFGHWHAARLNEKFLGVQTDESGNIIENHNTFVLDNFIGLDGCTNISGIVNILTVETEEEEIV